MTRYELARIKMVELFLETTHPGTLDWAENELRKHYPRYVHRTSRGVELRSDPKKSYHDPNDRGFLKATEGLYSVVGWLLAEMLQQGWEPFAVDHGLLYLRWRYED